MTTLFADQFLTPVANPVDTVEEVAQVNDWTFDRDDDELTAVLPGSFCDYQLRCLWREEGRALQIANLFDLKVPEAKRPAVYEAIGRLNERLWLGHFEMWAEEGLIMFRHAAVVDGAIGQTHVELLIETAHAECERYYPVFQFILWSGKTAQEAIDAALLDVIGEA
ncbi:hypothetical protein EV659_103339 [Rhodothalassium salexigens DSM 2132]|uniref:Sensory transduction regulator n=1 Tax=Rhodothalassium salexigens DSM 2132 TaxID=1188247 RepID=A0A4R2PNU6_RHOSA|nr:YbjN domain-containing protein [Rhodothalassium salexigens]MBB4210894.1 hypothetical protein [Rhodothalassium salexigens DSM 2132]MBK1639002.1 hypothetical protein [Rhodothalassium salexigens DSM 2132]TCP36448.1 hypothetical protein EV659_103339 [Rhodothalassium salexigens DSM 2132]